MLSITRDQVPSYLVGGTLYKTLCLDDSEAIHVPVASFKEAPSVCGTEDVVHLLHTLQYWSVPDVSDELCTFLAREKPHSDFDELCVLLEEFLPQTKLVDWFRALWTLRKPYFQSEDEVKEAVQALVPHLLSPSGVVSDHSRIELIGIVHTIRYGESFVSRYLPSISGEIHDSSRVANVRNVAKLYACVCRVKFFGPQREELPFLLHLLGWPDEEVVEYACRALGNSYKYPCPESISTLNQELVVRFVEMLQSENPYIQATVVNAVRHFAFVSREWAGIIVGLGALSRMRDVLFAPEQPVGVLQNIMEAIAICCAGSAANIQAIMDLGVLHRIVELHKAGLLPKSAMEEEEHLWSAIISVVRATADHTQIQHIIQIGVIPVVCDLLPTEPKKDTYAHHLGILKLPISGRGDTLLQDFGAFLQKCQQVDLELWHSVVAQMKECGGVRSLQRIAGDSDHPSSRRAEDVLRSLE